jgi:hypothetical protein
LPERKNRLAWPVFLLVGTYMVGTPCPPSVCKICRRKKNRPAGRFFNRAIRITSKQPEQQQPKRRQQQPKQPKQQPKRPKQQRQQQPEQPGWRQRQPERPEQQPERRSQQPEQPERQPELLLSSSKQPEQQPAGKRSAEIFSWFFLN